MAKDLKETTSKTNQKESDIINSMSVESLKKIMQKKGEAGERKLLKNLKYTGRLLKSFPV